MHVELQSAYFFTGEKYLYHLLASEVGIFLPSRETFPHGGTLLRNFPEWKEKRKETCSFLVLRKKKKC